MRRAKSNRYKTSTTGIAQRIMPSGTYSSLTRPTPTLSVSAPAITDRYIRAVCRCDARYDVRPKPPAMTGNQASKAVSGGR